MPRMPKKPCEQIGCDQLVDRGYCEYHKLASRPPPGQVRVNPHRHLYNRRWERIRALFLKKNPFCVKCQEAGKLTPATEVDHIRSHQGNIQVFWDQDNWQPLCKPCHSRKTVKEDGGFSHKREEPGNGDL